MSGLNAWRLQRIGAAAAVVLLAAGAASGQDDRREIERAAVHRVGVNDAEPPRAVALTHYQVGSIRRSLERLDYGSLITIDALQPVTQRKSVGRRIVGGALGGVGGFFAGGYLGAKIDGQCDCDDPGFKGFLIGAPIGTVVGAILGAKFF
jgi:hypothetical protein